MEIDDFSDLMRNATISIPSRQQEIYRSIVEYSENGAGYETQTPFTYRIARS